MLKNVRKRELSWGGIEVDFHYSIAPDRGDNWGSFRLDAMSQEQFEVMVELIKETWANMPSDQCSLSHTKEHKSNNIQLAYQMLMDNCNMISLFKDIPLGEKFRYNGQSYTKCYVADIPMAMHNFSFEVIFISAYKNVNY